MSTELTPLSYVVLALVGREGASAHDLVRMAREGQRLYYAGAASKIYEQPKRLEALGYLTSEKQPGRTRERTYYRLTEAGAEALRGWLTEPSSFPRIRNDAVTRVLASDLADDPGCVIASLTALRGEIAELERVLDEDERRIPDLPHRAVQLRLVAMLGRSLLAAHREWIDAVERELGSPERATGRDPIAAPPARR